MPDVFDQISAPQAPAAAPKGDVFDQISSAPAAPKGDVFDQIAQPKAMPASPSAYFAQHSNMDPLAVNQAFQQLPGSNLVSQTLARNPNMDPTAVRGAVAQMGQPNIPARATGPMEAASNLGQQAAEQRGPSMMGGLMDNISKLRAVGQRELAGKVADVFGQNNSYSQNLQASAQMTDAATTPEGLRTTAGQLGGGAAMLSAGPAGAAAMGLNAAAAPLAQEESAENIANEQKSGRPSQAGAAATNALIQGPLAYAGGRLIPGAAAGGLAARLGLRAAERTVLRAGEGYGINAAQTGLSNLGTKLTTNPNQRILEGVNTSGLMGAGLTAAGGAVHDVAKAATEKPTLSKMRQNVAEKAAPQAPAPEAAKPPVMPEAVQAPKTPETAAPAPAAAAPEAPAHPDRFDDVQKLTDWYKSHHPEEKTGDVIKAMTPDMPHVKANVPVDFAQGVGEDVDRGKVDSLKGLSQDERDKLPPSILGPNGDIIDGGHRIAAAKESGATHVQAYVPESLIGQHGIEVAQPKGEATAVPPGGETNPLIAKSYEKMDQEALAQTPIAPTEGEQRAMESFSKTPEQQPGQNVRTSEQVQTPEQKPAEAIAKPVEQEAAPTKPGILRTFADRDIHPAIAKLHDAAVKSWGAINRALGTGASWTLQDRDSANRISKGLAEHKQAMHQLEAQLTPHRETFKTMTDKESTEWADQVEATGESTRKDLQPAADLNRKLNEQNIEEGKEVGLNTKKWEGDYLGRLAKFPDQLGGDGTRKTAAGPQNFLKGRTFETYGEFRKFVEDHGGEMAHDNAMDTLLAKQAEIRRSIMARKTMRGEEERNTLKWVENKTTPPEGFNAKLKDPLAQEDRPVVAPKWMVGKLAKMAHFDAQKYMESPEWKKNTQTLRPGDEMPEGFSHTGENKSGTYMGNDNIADQFNNLISPGLKGHIPILHQLASFVKGSVNLSLNLSGAHYLNGAYRSMSGAVGRGLSNIVNKEWGLLGQNAKMAVNPLSSMKYGAKGIEEYRNPGSHPELASQVKGAVEGGAVPHIKSVLDPNHFAEMKKEWDAGNPLGSFTRLVKGINGQLHKPLFDHFIPKIKFAAQMMSAAAHEQRDLAPTEMQRQQSKATDLTDNLLGQVQRDRQFQNHIVTDAMDLLMTAPKFFEGDVREVGAAGRDTIQALRGLAAGTKGTKLTPAMYSMAGHAIMQVTLASLTQMGLSTYNTGKPIVPTSLQDLIKPRTGRKDDKGRDERIYIPTPISAMAGVAAHPGNAVYNRLAAPYRVAAGEIRGADEHNVELKGLGERTGFAIRGMSPYSAQAVTDTETPGRPGGIGKTAASAMGIHYSYTAGSDAEQAASDAMSARRGDKIIPREQADKSHLIGTLAAEMRAKNPDAQKHMQEAVKDGKLTIKDYKAVVKQSHEAQGLAGSLKSSSLDAEDLMEKVWPKMTPQERQDNQAEVHKKIRMANKPSEWKQKYWDQIKKDVVTK